MLFYAELFLVRCILLILRLQNQAANEQNSIYFISGYCITNSKRL